MPTRRALLCSAAWALGALPSLGRTAAGVVRAASENATRATQRRLLQVGSQRDIKTIAAAASQARDGDIIELDAESFVGDVAIWTQRDLTVRAPRGRAHLIASGASAEGKAIWVVRADNFTAQGVEFSGARVADGNGAGIRFELGKLRIRDCFFHDNENGILASPNPAAVLHVENSEFANNGAGDGRTHHLYVGGIDELTVRSSYFHHGKKGHLLKSRARRTVVTYNRLTDEASGHASYELEFPNGGLAIVLGNLIEQSAQTENGVIVSFGAEGYTWQRNELYLAHNTIVNDRVLGGVFVSAAAGQATVQLFNNVFVGSGSLDIKASSQSRGNMGLRARDFVAPRDFDYRLVDSAAHAVGRVADPGLADGLSLRPAEEYVHPCATRAIPARGRWVAGAYQPTISQ
jgi:hypothetical protein